MNIERLWCTIAESEEFVHVYNSVHMFVTFVRWFSVINNYGFV